MFSQTFEEYNVFRGRHYKSGVNVGGGVFPVAGNVLRIALCWFAVFVNSPVSSTLIILIIINLFGISKHIKSNTTKTHRITIKARSLNSKRVQFRWY